MQLGSPPRVREKLFGHLAQYHVFRITPACAGKTNRQNDFDRMNWDHPRVCGKNLVDATVGKRVLGSPPRVREKHKYIENSSKTNGITPACAGKTLNRQRCCHAKKDHPRVCGKNFLRQLFALKRLGSPPRVREKHLVLIYILIHSGITPACAGKTCYFLCCKQVSQDHPRVCGKN